MNTENEVKCRHVKHGGKKKAGGLMMQLVKKKKGFDESRTNSCAVDFQRKPE